MADEEHVLPEGRVLPLNSKRLLVAHIRALAEELGLPTRATTDEVRQLIEGKLMDMGHAPSNVRSSSRSPLRTARIVRYASLWLASPEGLPEERWTRVNDVTASRRANHRATSLGLRQGR